MQKFIRRVTSKSPRRTSSQKSMAGSPSIKSSSSRVQSAARHFEMIKKVTIMKNRDMKLRRDKHNVTLKVSSFELGGGSFGVVYRGFLISRRTEDFLADEEIMIAVKVPNEKGEKYFKKELEYYQTLTREGLHHHIVKFYGFLDNADDKLLILEPCFPGSFSNFFKANGRGANIVSIFFLGCPIVDAVRYLHAKGMLHRDIKPKNMLITLTGRPVLGDLGSAHEGEVTQGTKLVYGTDFYKSPECQARTGEDRRSDIYSLGISFASLFGKNVPKTFFAKRSRIINAMRDDNWEEMNSLTDEIHSDFGVTSEDAEDLRDAFQTSYFENNNLFYKMFGDAICLIKYFLQINPDDRMDLETFCDKPSVKECIDFWAIGQIPNVRETVDAYSLRKVIFDNYVQKSLLYENLKLNRHELVDMHEEYFSDREYMERSIVEDAFGHL